MFPRLFTSLRTVLNDKIDEATENGLMFDLCEVDVTEILHFVQNDKMFNN